MASNLRELRRKKGTIQHIRQITWAMKAVATARLRRIQQRVRSGRRYQEELRRLLGHVASALVEVEHPYLQEREVSRVGLLVVGGNRGLCGAFNRELHTEAVGFVEAQSAPVEVITVGDRMHRYADRSDLNIVSSHSSVETADDPCIEQVIGQVRSWYESSHVDRVQVVYARFESIMSRTIVSEQLLPLSPETFGESRKQLEAQVEYIFEPPAQQLLAQMLPRALQAEIAQLLLGTTACAEAARIQAMTAATDNAEDMISDLARSINRARQEEITAELLDVVGGARALQS